MTSQSQIDANRENAKESTGPTSDPGKAKVAKNALKHGLFAKNPVLSWEDQAEFDELQEQLETLYSPEGQIEKKLFEQILSLSWRLQRLVAMEGDLLESLPEEGITDSLLKQLDRLSIYENRLQRKLDKVNVEYWNLQESMAEDEAQENLMSRHWENIIDAFVAPKPSMVIPKEVIEASEQAERAKKAEHAKAENPPQEPVSEEIGFVFSNPMDAESDLPGEDESDLEFDES